MQLITWSKHGQVRNLAKMEAKPLAEQEPGTTTWYALKIGPSKYGIFDSFANDEARNAHLTGDIAKTLFAKASDLFVREPKIDKPELLAAKARGD